MQIVVYSSVIKQFNIKMHNLSTEKDCVPTNDFCVLHLCRDGAYNHNGGCMPQWKNCNTHAQG